MNVYLHQNDGKQRLTSEKLLRLSLAEYNDENQLGLTVKDLEEIEILRTDKGRPYFKTLPINFSISHSDNIWVCAMGICQVGIDIQKIKGAKTIEIAKRFFTQEEADFTEDHESEFFFRIWTRKEAVVKFIGQGISSGFDKFSVIGPEGFLENLQFPAQCHLESLDMIEHFECCICTKEKETIWIKKL